MAKINDEMTITFDELIINTQLTRCIKGEATSESTPRVLECRVGERLDFRQGPASWGTPSSDESLFELP